MMDSHDKLHLYDGSMDQSASCDVCGEPAKSLRHFRNGGQICDMMEGACSCGAWHNFADFESK